MNKCIVYGLLDPAKGEIRYIGQTKLIPRRRLERHRSTARLKPVVPVHFWIRKVIQSGGYVDLVVLQEDAIWNKDEIELIERYRAQGARLLNVTGGGDGTYGAPQSTEERKRKSERAKTWWASRIDRRQPPWTAEQRENHRIACKQRGQGPHWLGAKHSEETKEKMRLAWEARKQSGTKEKKSPWTPERKAAASAREKARLVAKAMEAQGGLHA